MKVLEPTVEVIKQEDFSIKGIKQFIERCARLSYKSEDKITDDSYEKFVQMLIDKDHARPLEFGTVHLKMNIDDFFEFLCNLSHSESLNCLWIKWYFIDDTYYITTNYRYYTEVCLKYSPYLAEHCFTEEDNKFYPKRYAAKFIISRGIMDEFRTHISLSSIAESTRYCNYSKGKFNGELTFIEPCWITSDIKSNLTYLNYVDTLQKIEDTYITLTKNGWKAEEARNILPLSLKTELYMCGFAEDWKKFFELRCASNAHPQAKELAIPLKEEFIKRGYINE